MESDGHINPDFNYMIMTQQQTMKITVYGKVQGVGFRPLVCRLAKKNGLTGFVRNAGTHVEIVATGTAENIDRLCESLTQTERPIHVDEIQRETLFLCEEKNDGKAIRPVGKTVGNERGGATAEDFIAVPSTEADEVKCVSADIGLCPHCLQEIKEKGNRREGYSYISCAQCGPRYTIIRKLPYDRINTTMDAFDLCGGCGAEYHDMQDRRGHGETISCFRCGPQLKCYVKKLPETKFLPLNAENIFLESDKKTVCVSCAQDNNFFLSATEKGYAACVADASLVGLACEMLENGQIIMVKAVGGFNLLCRADRREPVTRLRDLKKRISKPFAVMVKDAGDAEKFSYVSPAEKELLESEARPIVLLQKKSPDMVLAENVTDVSDQVGVLLPSMGFYALLDTSFPVIVTSCNYAGEPILHRDDEAFRFFEGHDAVAALFTYDREILRPADDGVTRVIRNRPQVLRRTKGYMPEAAVVPDKDAVPKAEGNIKTEKICLQGDRYKHVLQTEGPYGDAFPEAKILAVGAEMKPGFCLTAGGRFYPAEIPGDITLECTERFYEETVGDWIQLLGIRPEAVTADLHPGYAGTRWGRHFAKQNGLPFYQVQHHHAHALSVIAEHRLQGKVLAACFDGTGLGTDGTVWGGEFLLCEGTGCRRIGHLKPVSMLGGDASMQQAWKTALCHLAAVGVVSPDPRFAVVKAALQRKINCIETSSMGRLFDAAAAILGLADFNSHEGRCAMALEAAARKAVEKKITPLAMAFAKEEVTGGDPVIRYTGESVNKNLEPETAEAKRRLTEGEKEITETGRIAAETKSTVTEAARKVLYDPAPLWEAVTNLSVGNEESVYAAALGFHNAVTDIVTDMAERAGIGQVILAGGCFANRILLENCISVLQERGFRVYYNEKVSPGDGGISVGQAFYGSLRNR